MNRITLELVGGYPGETGGLLFDEDDEAHHLSFVYRGRTILAAGSDYFESLCGIRLELEREGLIPLCYGASLNVFPSSMSRQMDGAVKAYRLFPGQRGSSKDLVEIFMVGPDITPAFVAAQEAFYGQWLRSLSRAS